MAYIGKEPLAGNFVKLDAITTSATATYPLERNSVAFKPANAESLLVSLNGVTQAPLDAYTVNDTNIVFANALTSSDTIDYILALGEIGAVTTPADSTVDTPKLTTGAVTAAKLATDSVTTIKIADDAVTGAKIENNPTIAGNLTVSGNIVGTLTTVAQPNITSVGTLSGLTVSGNIGGTLTTAAQPNITSTGTLTNLRTSDIVGIGQASPTSPNGATSFLHIGNGDEQDTSIVLQDAVEIWEIYQNDNLHFRYDTTDVMTMERLTGNIGIGTTSPTSPLGTNYKALDINSGVWGGTVNFSGNSGGYIGNRHSGNTGLGYYAVSGQGHYFAVNGSTTAVATINSDGRVGIGAAGESTVKLEVNAGALATTISGRSDGGNGNNRRFNINAIASGNGTYGGGLVLETRDNSNVWRETLRANHNRQIILGGSTADANGKITVKQAVSNGLGGIFIDTYSYYSNIPGINITNGDTNNQRNMEDVEFHRNGGLRGYIRISHSGVSFTSNSDYRLKEDEKEITNAIEQIKKLKPYNFKWKNSDDRQDGFFAHEIGEVFDYVAQGEKDAIQVKKNVVCNKDGFVIAQNIEKEDWEKRKADADNEEASPKGETTYPTDSTWQKEYEDIKPQTIDNSKLVPILTAALQEAIKRIEVLESK